MLSFREIFRKKSSLKVGLKVCLLTSATFKLGSVLIFAVLIIGTLQARERLDPKVHTYRTRIAATEQTCATEAQLLAQRFESIPDVVVLNSACVEIIDIRVGEDSTAQIYSLRISYQVTEPIEIESTFVGRPFLDQVPSSNVGLYSGYRECVSDQNFQVEEFEKHTGAYVLSVSCLPDDVGSIQEYLLRIDSHGKLARSLFVYQLDNRTGVDTQIQSLLLNWVTLAGGRPVGWKNEFLLYYGKSSLPIQHVNFGSFSTRAACESQVSTIETIFDGLFADQAYAYCKSHSFGNSESTRYLLEGYQLGHEIISSDFGYNSPVYFTFQECMNDRMRLADERTAAGDGVLGVVCHSTNSERSFRAEIYRTLR